MLPQITLNSMPKTSPASAAFNQLAKDWGEDAARLKKPA